MKTKKQYDKLPYRERLRLQLEENSMWFIFMRWLAKINQRKQEKDNPEHIKLKKVENQRVKPPKNQ